MNINEAIKLGGIAYRESCIELHRGSHKDGYINIKYAIASNSLSFEDIAADDWVVRPIEYTITKEELYKAFSDELKDAYINDTTNYLTSTGVRALEDCMLVLPEVLKRLRVK